MPSKHLVLLSLLLPTVAFAEDSRQIYMLETALAPRYPILVAETWARAAKNRNGAVQYMMMCPDLQKKHLSNLKDLNWVTGVSSPWIANYKIIVQTKKSAASQFTIEYQLADGSGKAGNSIDHISVIPAQNSSQQWCINQFQYLSPSDGAH